MRKLPCERNLFLRVWKKIWLVSVRIKLFSISWLICLIYRCLFLGVHELRAAFCSAFTSGVIFSKTSNELTVPSLIQKCHTQVTETHWMRKREREWHTESQTMNYLVWNVIRPLACLTGNKSLISSCWLFWVTATGFESNHNTTTVSTLGHMTKWPNCSCVWNHEPFAFGVYILILKGLFLFILIFSYEHENIS